jgi:hypothetical protein
MVIRRVDDIAARTLEAYIDRYGLAAVLHSIADVCALKADHIAESWQEPRSAVLWQQQGAERIESLATALEQFEQFTRNP